MLPKIFENVRVLDFSRLLPGPFASDLLVRMGAEVTCIQSPHEDPLLGAYSPFEKIRYGKNFRTVDLKSSAGKKAVEKLASESQVLLEGFRPGTMERLGLGFEQLCEWKPDILYVSLVGYSEDHSKFSKGAHDLNFLVDAGIYSLLYPDSSDAVPALQLADVFGGFYAAFQIIAAWFQRSRQSKGSHLIVSVTEGLERLADYLQHESSIPLLPMLTGGLARYRIYWTKDKNRVAVAALEPKFFENLLKTLKIDLTGGEGEEEIAEQIQKRLGDKSLSEWKEIFGKADACVSFIPGREEVLRRR